jgi:ubiquinone/menaquinone biosynthesis C-methylase UbiE
LARKASELRDSLLMPGYTLNVGAGYGDLEMILGQYCEIISIDIDLSALVIAKSLIRRMHGSSIIILADGRRLPFRSKSISNIVLSQTLHHIDPKAPFVKEISRVLRPRGRMIVYDANGSSPAMRCMYSKVWGWSPSELLTPHYALKLLESGGKIRVVRILYRFIIPDLAQLQGQLLKVMGVAELFFERIPVLNRLCGIMIIVAESSAHWSSKRIEEMHPLA